MIRLNLVITSLFLLTVSGCVERPHPVQEYTRENFVMDTLIHIKVCTSEPVLAQKALEGAFAEFARIARLSDRFAEKNMPNPEVSDVYRINQNAGIKPVQVSEDTLNMLEKGNYYSGLCDGAFDVTVGPIMDLWGFGTKQYRIPSDGELASGLVLVGYRQIVVDKVNRTVFLPQKGMEIDLGGVAKGYATDRVVQKLREMGIQSGIINAGGNVYAWGSQPDGSPWLVGIQDPRDDNKLIAVLKVKDTALVTSGDYERYFIQNGTRYHHILDPSTGKPSRKAISATIIAPVATDADILSTATFVIGGEKGIDFIKKFPGINIVLTDSQNIYFSRELKNRIEFVEGNGYRVNSY